MLTKTDHRENTERQLGSFEKGARTSITAPIQGTKADKSVRLVPLDRIMARKQIREEFNEEELHQLGQSLKKKQLQPCTVFWSDDDNAFVLIAGERRYRAAKLVGLESLRCTVFDYEPAPEELHELQLIENVQRKDLKPIEEARGYQRFKDEFGYTQPQIAAKTGKNQSTISRALSLLKLPEDLQGKVGTEQLPLSLAYKIAKKDEVQQRTMLTEYNRGEVTIRDALSSKSKKQNTPIGTERTKKARGIRFSGRGKKSLTNTDFALGALDWCEDLALDKRASVDLDAIRKRLNELLEDLSVSLAQTKAA